MATLWGGRFEKAIDEKAFEFNKSITFDKALILEDIQGSIAHASMLSCCGIISKADSEKIIKGLLEIKRECGEDGLTLPDNIEEFEDIHSFVEATLINKIGDAGKRLHTARSRNDQVAVDFRSYVKNKILDIQKNLYGLLKTLEEVIKDHRETVMPGFTHMQKAQPISLGLHMDAYFEMFKRDFLRLNNTYELMNECPLGACALGGTTYPIDRDITSEALGFDRPTANAMDSVSDRDFALESLSDLAMIQMHLSRFCEEIIAWNSNEYGFIEIDDGFSTGSSIMPQKKNPDMAELIRGKTGRVYGDMMSLFTTMKGLPLAYNKDMQEDKEPVMDAFKTVGDSLIIFTGMLSTMKFKKEAMEQSAKGGFTNATDLADYLVRKQVPFRDAHEIVGKIVLYAQGQGKALDRLSLKEYREYSAAIEEDVYGYIDIKACVEKRNSYGGPGGKSLGEKIKCNEILLKDIKAALFGREDENE